MSNESWYSVKCHFVHNDLASRHDCPVYEERILLFRAPSFDEAIIKAEMEANEYATSLGETEFLGLSQAFHLFDEQINDGVELYSLMRKVNLKPEEYLEHYHDDGTEFSQRDDDETTA